MSEHVSAEVHAGSVQATLRSLHRNSQARGGFGCAQLLDVAQQNDLALDRVEALRELRVDGRRVIVVSASKSGPEVGFALGRLLRPAEIPHVLAWVSIGGVVRGSPLADEAIEPRLCWFVKSQFAREGFDLDGLESLQTEPRRAAAEAMEFPDHLFRLSYVALPLSGDVGRRARLTYRRMRDDGPNDGLTLLIDELIPGGHAIVELGSDHYFQRPDQPERTLALLTVVLTRLGFDVREPSTAT